MMLSAVLGAVVLAALPVQVESTTCPSGHEVEQALAAMLPSLSQGLRPDVARVLRVGDRLHLELVNPEAAPIAQRWIDVTGSCLELAELIAVVIASWESDVHPEFTRPHVEPLAPSVKPAAPPSLPSPGPVAFYEVAAGASLSWSGSAAAAGILTMGWAPRGAGPGLHLSATVESARTRDLSSGAVAGQGIWRRWTGSAELDWRLPGSGWALNLHGGVGLGWLDASGVGYLKNYSGISFAPGGTAGVRFSRRTNHLSSIWLELAASYWPRKQLLFGQPNGTPQEVPHYQGLASIGLALGQSPSGR